VFRFNTFVGPINYTRTSCVRDNVTGLIWEGKEASGTRAGSNTYSNLGNGAVTDASGYVAAVNASALCGFTDWRLPTRQELLTLVDYGAVTPGQSIKQDWFPNTNARGYWSSEGVFTDSSRAWSVQWHATGGASIALARAFSDAVRLVRGAPPAGPRYTFSTVAFAVGGEFDSANNVVNDAWTGLQWRRCLQGQRWSGSACVGSVLGANHEGMLDHARQQVGWRMPNVKELASLVDLAADGSTRLDLTTFPGADSGWAVWSSTPYQGLVVGSLPGAWGVNFGDGRVSEYGRRAGNTVRLVRVRE
jgi:hypothetical protein